MRFKLNDYFIAKVRDGESERKKNAALSNVSSDDLVVVYNHDVYTYYYAVPVANKSEIGGEILELFYKDNYDYSDEQLEDFKIKYSEFFG